jgi:hypothetical protein
MNYYENFLEYLKKEGKFLSSFSKSGELDLFIHLIQLMGEENFNSCFKYYFIDMDNLKEGFFDFHKSMRQTDFYNEYYRMTKNPESKKNEYENIGGHLDMIFWDFIQMSDKPFEWLSEFTENIKKGKYENDIRKS